MLKIRCEGCGHKVGVPETYVGRKAKCPSCQAAMLITETAGVLIVPAAQSVAPADQADSLSALAAAAASSAAVATMLPTPAPMPSSTAPEAVVLPSPAATPLPVLPPLELLQKHPKTATAILLTFLLALIAVGLAMSTVGEKHGGSKALWNLFLAGLHVALGIGLHRRLPHVGWATVCVSAFNALVLLNTIGDGDGTAFHILMLVVSVAIGALLVIDRDAFPKNAISVLRPSTASSAGVTDGSVSGGLGHGPHLTASTAYAGSVTNRPSKPASDRAMALRKNSKAMFVLFAVMLVWASAQVVLAKNQIAAPQFVTTFLGLAILGGGLFSLYYICRNFGAISKQPSPHAALGLVGGIGMSIILAFGIIGVVQALTSDDLRSGQERELAGNLVSYSDLDLKFGASGVDYDGGARRARKTSGPSHLN